MPDTLDSILEELVGHYASKDNYGEYWGHDTTCGKGEAISLAHQKIEMLMLSEDEVAKIINEVSENQVKPYVVIEWKNGQSIQKSFGEFFAQAIHNSMLKKLKEGGE